MGDNSLIFEDSSNSYLDILPPRTVSEAVKKSKGFKRDLLDKLERIGHKQMLENLKYVDIFKAIRGELRVFDFTEGTTSGMYKDIAGIRDEIGIATELINYDFIGEVLNILMGEYLLQKDKFRFDTVDEVSTNEYIRTQTQLLDEYAQAKFNLELEKRFAQMGVDPNAQMESEEEQQQYLQQLEAEAERLIPSKIREGMRSWKTSAAQWAEKTYSRDEQRFNMDLLESEEVLNHLVTGIAPRHYLIGYDYYEPEAWNPINTFYSKDLGLRFIQDAEYAGRVDYMAVHELIERYGHKLTASQIKKLSESFSGKYLDRSQSSDSTGRSIKELAEKNFLEPTVLPFRGADDYALHLQMQDALDIPMGEKDENLGGGDRWLPEYGFNNTTDYRHAYLLQNRGGLRSDLVQVTEAYVKCYKEIGLLTYRTENGYLDTVEVDENLLGDFLKENEIKKLRNVTFEEAMKNPEEGTIVYTYVPKIYSGLKFKTSTTFVGEDMYFLEPLEFEIRSNSNYYKKQLPVFSYIGESVAEPMMPYQRDFNWVLNQNRNLMEKELGMFFMLDVNFMPSEYLDLTGDSKDQLTSMYNIIKEIGILPVDMSKHNLADKGGVAMNSLSTQNVTYTPQIQRNIELSRYFKQEALSKIGITPQREGTPTSYETATGVMVAQNAGYSKTANIFQRLLYDKVSKIEGHLAVAQYCQLNNKDSNYIFRAGDDELVFLQTIKDDPDFALRQFGVYPVMDASKKRDFERVKEVILSRNTTNADDLALMELLYSDDYLELRQAGEDLRAYNEEITRQAQEHQSEMLDKELEMQREFEKQKIQLEYDKLENRLEHARITGLGRIGANKNVEDPVEDINEAADIALKQKEYEARVSETEQKLTQRYEESRNNFELKLKELQMREKQLAIRERERRTKEYTSEINKN